MDGGISPTSSRNSVPRCAVSTRPGWSRCAPVKLPFMWPNSSLSSRSAASAPQCTATNGPHARALHACSARATSSLPVPVGPAPRPAPRTAPAGAPRRAAVPAPGSVRPCQGPPPRSLGAGAATPHPAGPSARRAPRRSPASAARPAWLGSPMRPAPPRSAKAWSAWPVSTTTGVGRNRGTSSSPATGSNRGGMDRSSSTTSGAAPASNASAAAPSPATTTSCPKPRSQAAPSRWNAGSSSTSSTRPGRSVMRPLLATAMPASRRWSIPAALSGRLRRHAPP